MPSGTNKVLRSSLQNPCRSQAHKRCWLWISAAQFNLNKVPFQHQTVSQFLKPLKCCAKGLLQWFPELSVFSANKHLHAIICLSAFVMCSVLPPKACKQTQVICNSVTFFLHVAQTAALGFVISDYLKFLSTSKYRRCQETLEQGCHLNFYINS